MPRGRQRKASPRMASGRIPNRPAAGRLHRGGDQRADAGGERYGEGAPEGHAQRCAKDVGAACFGADGPVRRGHDDGQ